MRFTPDSQDILHELELLNDGSYQAEAAWMSAWLGGLRAASTATEYFNLHRELLVRFGARQALIEQLAVEKQQARGSLSGAISERPKPIDVIQERQQALREVEHLVRVQKALLHVLRMLGDALVWTSLRYNRLAIAVLGDGQRVGRLSAPEGRQFEMAALGRLWADGTFAIVNDITNCLRRGDITAVKGVGSNELGIGIAEIKASGELAEDAPQARRINDAIELLLTGEHATMADGQPLRVVLVPSDYRTYLAALANTVRNVGRTGVASTRPHPAIAVFAVDYRRAQDEAHVNRELEQFESGLGWANAPQDVFRFASTIRLMRDRRASYSYLAPLTLLPLAVDDVAAITLGFISVSVSMNIRVLERCLSRQGMQISIMREPESFESFLTAQLGRTRVTVPAQLREQMLVELMTPATMADALLAAIQDVNAHSGSETARRLIAFAREERAWSPPRD